MKILQKSVTLPPVTLKKYFWGFEIRARSKKLPRKFFDLQTRKYLNLLAHKEIPELLSKLW